jgi:peptide/nickel transport system ATP-binding protein/peptide/nickel transport system permease protein
MGLALGVALLFVAVGADWLAPYDPAVESGPPSAPPDARHWLGTNDVGHDILSELLHASRVSLAVGLGTALLATTIGLGTGAMAGYLRGPLDALLMRVADLVLVLPFLPLLILIAAYAGSGRTRIVVVLALVMWARPARLVRAQTLSIAAADFVLASRALGAGTARLVWHHVLPAVLPLGLTQFVRIAGSAIALESGLAFLGLGDPTAKSWGTMLFYAQARNAVLTGQWPWWVVPPGLLIAAAVLSCACLGLSDEPADRSQRTAA